MGPEALCLRYVYHQWGPPSPPVTRRGQPPHRYATGRVAGPADVVYKLGY